MNFSNVTPLLGSYYGEPALQSFLADLQISEAPKVPKGETTAFLNRADLGIELTFTDERYLDNPTRAYPEGALVLENIRFYGVQTPDFQVFTGTLPQGLKFGATMKQLGAELGEPDWFDEDLGKARWDRADHAVFVGLDEQGRSDVYALQTPVDDE